MRKEERTKRCECKHCLIRLIESTRKNPFFVQSAPMDWENWQFKRRYNFTIMLLYLAEAALSWKRSSFRHILLISFQTVQCLAIRYLRLANILWSFFSRPSQKDEFVMGWIPFHSILRLLSLVVSLLLRVFLIFISYLNKVSLWLNCNCWVDCEFQCVKKKKKLSNNCTLIHRQLFLGKSMSNRPIRNGLWSCSF